MFEVLLFRIAVSEMAIARDTTLHFASQHFVSSRHVVTNQLAASPDWMIEFHEKVPFESSLAVDKTRLNRAAASALKQKSFTSPMFPYNAYKELILAAGLI